MELATDTRGRLLRGYVGWASYKDDIAKMLG